MERKRELIGKSTDSNKTKRGRAEKFIMKKVKPLKNPLLLIVIVSENSARHEGKPIPNDIPKITDTKIACKNESLQNRIDKSDANEPKRIHIEKREILLILVESIKPIKLERRTDM